MKDKKHDDKMYDDAKMQILEELRELAMELMKGKMGDRLGSMKEVSVAAPDEEGLEKGLDMAKEVIKKRPEDMIAEAFEGEDEEDDEEEDEE